MSRIQLIIGHVTPRSARVWVRGQAGDVRAHLEYHPAHQPEATRRLDVDLESKPEAHQSAVIELTNLTPGTRYALSASFQNGDVRVGAVRTPPEEPRPFSFLLVSCNKQKQSRRQNYQGVNLRFLEEDLSFIVHCGDQIYYDHESDPRNPPAHEIYARRYDETWGGDPYASEMLARFPNYMLLDDHEIANDFNKDDLNNREGLYAIRVYRDPGIAAYEAFQVSHGPGLHPSNQANHKRYDYSFDHGDAKFFAMDARLDRLPIRTGADPGEIISPDQERDLYAWMRANPDAVKFVITPLPFVGDITKLAETFGEAKWSSRRYRGQRERILDFIAENEIRGLVFLTGDMHASYHAEMKITRPDDRVIMVHELMSSPVYHRWRPFWGTGLRNRVRKIKLPGGSRARGKIDRIYPLSAAMKIDVDPARRTIGWTIHSLKKRRDLRRQEFSV